MPEAKTCPTPAGARVVRGKDGKLKLEDFYTPLWEAKKEIRRRWNDKELKKKVEEFLGKSFPDFMGKKPRAVLARHLNTPDNEFFRFLDLSKKVNLAPVCPEYLDDIFIPENKDKHCLGKLYFHSGKGRNGGDKINILKIIDFKEAERKKIKEIKTIWGENLADFHHKLLINSFGEKAPEISDASKWIKKIGGNPSKYYLVFLALFIRNGILFENFINTKDEKKFINTALRPNFEKLYKLFGLKPLIVPLFSLKEINDVYWNCYPEKIKRSISIVFLPK